ncbi:hypothetical protein JXB27_03330 [Candidatus Woesearchaeota archaeon]|nr:hypothetical protein [Candidatus Woesearchaeota archaeon]
MADDKEPDDKKSKKGEEITKKITNITNVIGATGSGAVAAAKIITPSMFTILVVLSVLGSLYDYFYGGYIAGPFSPAPLLVDVVIFSLFAVTMRSLLGIPLLFFIIERTAPFMSSFVATVFPSDMAKIFAGIVIVAPYWLIYCFILKAGGQGKSFLADIVFWVALIFVLLLVILNIKPIFEEYDYVINQKAVDQAKKFLVDTYSEIIMMFKTAWCSIVNTPACIKDLQAASEEETLEQSMNIKEVPDSGFSVRFADFVSENQVLLDNQQAVGIEAVNNLNVPITLNFMCGLDKRGEGIPNPATLSIVKGRLSFQDSTIMCTNLDIGVKKQTRTNFYFNITATNAVSTGEKTLLVMDRTAKNSVLSKYPGVSENRILLLSNEFGEYLQRMQNELGAKVSQDDLIQPLIVAGAITTAESRQTLIYGVAQDVEIPFALFIKNNGKGKITKINSITFDLPEDIHFTEENCRVNPDELAKKNWGSIAKGKFVMVSSCRLVFSSSQYPNNPEPKTISVRVTYDYTVSEEANIYLNSIGAPLEMGTT